MSTHPAVWRAVALAERRFDGNRRLAFVGGSHASDTAGPTSDIDIFVVLSRPDRDTEEQFAEELRELHAEQGLSFAHCGEVFDAATLVRLLDFTDACLTAMPALQHLACYQADCLLSVFRKGDVVFKFLTDRKIGIRGDTHYLTQLERRAADFLSRFPMPRVQHHKRHLQIAAGTPEGTLLADLTARLDGPSWKATPVGVDLGRWFRRSLPERPPGRPGPLPVIDPRSCPLHATAPESATRLLRAQCLAHLPTEGEQRSWP